MLKKYIAKSHIAVSVTFPNGSKKHIAFDAKTGGGSVYYTNDENEQAALESHNKFGKLFKVEVIASAIPAKPAASAPATPENGTPETGERAGQMKEIMVNDLNEAKDYLCETFGLSRTKLKSKKAIVEAAEANKISFIGI